MNSKILAKRLAKMGYTLRRDELSKGWHIYSVLLGYGWYYNTLSDVERFTVDEENMEKYAAKN